MNERVGELSVLSTGRGDIKVTFSKSNPLEVERAKRMIEDMLRRGYVLFVEVDGKLTKVKKFDADHGEYIVATDALYPAENEEQQAGETKRGRGRPPGRRVKMVGAKATGVAPTAGG